MTRIEQVETQGWPGAGIGLAWRLESSDLRLIVAEFGAHILHVELRDGARWVPISVDYPDATDPTGWHGASVGRWANRIEGSTFELDNTTYALDANEGAHCLHGGSGSFGLSRWTGRPVDGGVELSLTSPDGDQGFPGELSATCLITLDESQYQVTYHATTTAPTVVNLATHVYWNLSASDSPDGGAHNDLSLEERSLANHHLVIDTDSVVEVDERQIPIPGPPSKVDETNFDCRTRRPLESIMTAGGYDHCFLANYARLEHRSGRWLAVTSDQPGMQVYSGQHLEPNGQGIAFEPQRIPNAPNRPDLGESVLRPGETYSSTSSFTFGTSGTFETSGIFETSGRIGNTT